MAQRILTREGINRGVACRESGFRRWDFGDSVSLYYSGHDEWYDGPLYYKGWTVVVTWPRPDGARTRFVPIRVDREVAWDMLIQEYGKWVE